MRFIKRNKSSSFPFIYSNFILFYILINSFTSKVNANQVDSIDLNDLMKINDLNDKSIYEQSKKSQKNKIKNSSKLANENSPNNNNKANKELDPLWYLSRFGYLENKKTISTKKSGSLIMFPAASLSNSNNEALTNAIKKFQKFANLHVTGKLDNETLKMMKTPRCGHPDIIDDETKFNNSSRKKRYALQGSKWSKNRLRFKVGKYPKYGLMSRDMIDEELRRAFELWSNVADVEFELLNDQTKTNFRNMLLFDQNSNINNNIVNKNQLADIEVRFETGYHGDSEPFDGSGLILGHAYFPEFGGSTHFDADEQWTVRSGDGVNLYQVAVHEFGHALGLEHSENFDAIMAPFFRGYAEEFNLHSDDVTAIELLYGKSKRNAQKPNINKPVNHMPIPYDNTNDINGINNLHPSFTVLTPQSKSFERKTKNPFYPTFFSIAPPLTPLSTFGVKNNPYNQKPEYIDTQTTSLCLDGRFDAITVLSDGYTYIFKDSYVYKIDSNFILEPGYPKLTNTLFRGWNGLTYMSLPSQLDTVLHIPENGITYFFKNNLYWRSSKLYELDAGYPRLISENFRGLDSSNGFMGKLDASFVWSGNRRVYFVEGNKYWRFDFVTNNIEPGYPKRLSIWRGLPNRITDAFLWINGITYFFDNERYYRFNDLSFKVEDAIPPYPRYNAEYWFGCNSVNRLGKLMLKRTNTSKVNEVAEVNQEIREYETVSNLNSEKFGYSLIKPTTAGLPSRKMSLIEILTNRERKINGENSVSDSDEASVDHQADEEMDLKTYNNSNLKSDNKAGQNNEAIGFKFNILNSLIISILYYFIFLF